MYLGARMAIQVGGFECIRVTFQITPETFTSLEPVLRLIMRGYESQLEIRHAEQAVQPDRA